MDTESRRSRGWSKRITMILFATTLLVTPHVHFPTFNYYTQLVSGEALILARSKRIGDLLDDEHVSEDLKEKLRSVLEMREFAITELGLPRKKSFTSYVDTGRKFVSWIVTATPEFSTKPKMRCIPFVGCFSSLAYFDENDAKNRAEKLFQQGYDVSVRGVFAYSTIGYFDDPATNALFELLDYGYAGAIFHEMTHEKLYIKNDPAFNESFAVFVEHIGEELWVKKHYGAPGIQRLLAHREKVAEIDALIASTQQELEVLYRRELPLNEKRALKRAVFQKMQEKYEALKKTWGGYDKFDVWFSRPMNNTFVAGNREYKKFVPVFEKLFERSGKNFPKFYEAVRRLTRLPLRERRKEMERILAKPAS